jgi:hypothetical protein
MPETKERREGGGGTKRPEDLRRNSSSLSFVSSREGVTVGEGGGRVPGRGGREREERINYSRGGLPQKKLPLSNPQSSTSWTSKTPL